MRSANMAVIVILHDRRNVQEDRSASTITRDVPPIMEMKSKRCHQLQSCTPCHTVAHKCNSSPPHHTSKCTELEIGTTEWEPTLGIDLSNSRMSLIADIFAQSVRTTLDAQWLHTVIHWVESSKHTSMSWIHPCIYHFTLIVFTSFATIYDHISFLQPHKRYESSSNEPCLRQWTFTKRTRRTSTRRTHRSCCVNIHSMVMSAIIHRNPIIDISVYRISTSMSPNGNRIIQTSPSVYSSR